MDWKEIWNFTLYGSGDTSVTLGDIVIIFLSLLLLYLCSVRLKKYLIGRVFVKYKLDPGESQAFGTISQYTFIIIGAFTIVMASGIDLSGIGIIAGALGIGVGFGLQNIASNFISGVIILFERHIKVGDRIEVGNVAGNIIKISPRATTVITNDNIAIIVPNSEFINGRVINWSLQNKVVRFNFMVSVSYDVDLALVRKLLLDVAKENDGVLKDPPPDVLFDSFMESNIQLNLRVWSSRYCNTPKVLQSQLYYSVYATFKEHGIKISYPKREFIVER
jgi:small-conductance mechanosensitive channel